MGSRGILTILGAVRRSSYIFSAAVCLALIPIPGRAQGIPAGQYAAQEFLQPLEILPSDRIPAATFGRTDRDFIVCLGPNFQPLPEPPPAAAPDSARINNTILATLRTVGRDDLQPLRKALVDYRQALAGDPRFLAYLYNAGRISLILGDLEEARLYFERARAELPEFAGVYENLGAVHEALIRRGHPGEHLGYERSRHARFALAAYREMQKRDPFDLRPMILLGNFYLRAGELHRAREYFDGVIERLPESADAHLGLARIDVANGKYNAARRRLAKIEPHYPGGIVEKDGYDRRLYFERARVYERLNDYAAAVREYDRLLAPEQQEDRVWLELSRAGVQKMREATANRLQ